jgi:2-polyprenyl-3-methyl-5-hydroxy-6-metoxy-1,4-benzoquinol methylase
VLEPSSNETFAQMRANFVNSPEYIDLVKGYRSFLDPAYVPAPIDWHIDSGKMEKLLAHIESVWERYGKEDPYYSVATQDVFRKENLSEDAIKQFYLSGKDTMLMVERILQRVGVWDSLAKAHCMEYGCGLGRVTAQLARYFTTVKGLDISANHLAMAKSRMEALGIGNVSFQKVRSVSELEKTANYDFIFSVIVLQHNPPPVIADIIRSFFLSLNKGGIALFQVPVRIKGYRFEIDDYLKTMKQLREMEMHCFPQHVILALAAECDCVPLEIQDDYWTGCEHMQSQTFVIRKR